MKFEQPLVSGTLIKRYKRFLVDVELDSGEVLTAHTPNTGAMKGCSDPGSRVWLSISDNPKRKYPHTLELIETAGGAIAGVHTLRSNKLAEEAILSGLMELPDIASVRREVKYGEESSRIDLLLEYTSGKLAYVEVKNVTLIRDDKALFPDAVTKRGTKHLHELERMVAQGHEGIIFFCVQRNDATSVAAAQDIDPVYAEALTHAAENGVQVMACQYQVTPEEITAWRALPVEY